jgi:hypothetical protein
MLAIKLNPFVDDRSRQNVLPGCDDQIDRCDRRIETRSNVADRFAGLTVQFADPRFQGLGMLRLHVEIFAELRLVDAVRMILAESQGDIIATEIGEFVPVGIAAGSFPLLLLGPSPRRRAVLLLGNQVAVEEFAEDEFPANMKARRENFGSSFGWR